MADSQTPDLLWPPAFSAAIFDFDGTLAFTDSIWEKVDRAFLGARGIDLEPSYQKILSTLGFEAGAQYTIERYHLHESVEDICDEWTRMSRALYESEVKLRLGAQEYIFALHKRHIPCALATINDPEVLSASQHINLDDLFDVCVFGSDVNRSKDHPDIYLRALDRINALYNSQIKAENCIVFEDLLAGIRAAKSASFLTCALKSDSKTQNIQELKNHSDAFLEDWQNIELPFSF